MYHCFQNNHLLLHFFKIYFLLKLLCSLNRGKFLPNRSAFLGISLKSNRKLCISYSDDEIELLTFVRPLHFSCFFHFQTFSAWVASTRRMSFEMQKKSALTASDAILTVCFIRSQCFTTPYKWCHPKFDQTKSLTNSKNETISPNGTHCTDTDIIFLNENWNPTKESNNFNGRQK